MKESHKQIIEEIRKDYEFESITSQVMETIIERALIERDEQILELTKELVKKKIAELKH